MPNYMNRSKLSKSKEKGQHIYEYKLKDKNDTDSGYK